MCLNTEHNHEQNARIGPGRVKMRKEWPFGGSWWYDTPRSTSIALGLIALSIYLRTQSGEYVDKYLVPAPGVNWVVGTIAVLGVALLMTGVIYRARQRKSKFGQPAKLGRTARLR